MSDEQLREREQILSEFKPLFEKARAEKLWFYHSYWGIWFSPDELESNHFSGNFIQFANFKLRDPRERIKELEGIIESAKQQLESFKKSVEKSGMPVG